MSSIFDEVIDRRNTYSLKWDYSEEIFGRRDILPMWVADMDFKSPTPIKEAVIDRAQHGVFGYTRGLEKLSDSLTGWMKKRHDWEIYDKWLVYSPGVVTSVNTAILAYTNPGDKVLMQTPIYCFYLYRNNERELVTNPLKNNMDIMKLILKILKKPIM